MNTRTITVLVGTDHHPFDRLVAWADHWAAEHPQDDVLVQHGATSPPRRATGLDIMPPDELRARCAASDVVITHGGPGTITDAKASGHRPLVLARDPKLGEHVDAHQQRFVAWAAGKDLITRLADVDELQSMLADDPGRRTRSTDVDALDTERTAASVQQLVAATESGRRPVALDATKVVFIGGWGRSGSTLLEALLARLDGVVVLGEVTHLWERGLGGDELCACGQPFSRCPFWVHVGKQAFGGWDQVDLDRVRELKAEVDRQRRMPTTARRRLDREHRATILEYTQLFRSIYDAAAEVSGADVVVDSSKEIPLAMALSHDAQIDLRVLHMVRDSRGVAHSWSKLVERPEAHGEAMPQFSARWSTTMWLSLNAAVAGLRHRRVPVARVRYEDLVDDAVDTVRGAWRELGLPGDGELPMVDAGTIELRPTHSVAGNPMRFQTGLTTLRQDDEWRTSMPARDRRLVTAMSYPMLRYFGYRGR